MVKLYYILLLLFSTTVAAQTTVNRLPDPTRQDVIIPEPVKKPAPLKKAIKKVKKAKKARKNRIKKRKPIHYTLQQTLVSEFRKTAVVNGEVVMVGDFVRGAKIIKIDSDSVVMLVSGIPKTLYLTSRLSIKEAKR